MSDKAISVENLGPIEHFEFSGSKPGVTVFSGPNGVGKSIFQKAIQAAARGKGKVPLRDQTAHGSVEAFGATITIGANCRHTGAFEVLSLDGRFNLADLVDPRIDTPALADAARFKALVSLTGVPASPNLFRNHESFRETFDAVVDPESITTDDLVEMARKVKKNYDESALSQERAAIRENAQAVALIPPKDLDLTAESDAKVLQAERDAARDVVTQLSAQTDNAIRDKQRVKEANALLEELQHEELTTEKETLDAAILAANEEYAANQSKIEELRKQAVALQARNKALLETSTNAAAKLEGIARQLELVQKATEAVKLAVTQPPTDEETEEAAARLTEATAAVERGTLIRTARENEAKAAAHRKAAKVATETAVKYRDAAKATDEVLSASIKCKYLRVQSDGKNARLVTDTERGPNTLYHDLSDGQKYTIAVKIGADAVGEDGLLTVDQIGWEGIDADNRISLDRDAKEHKVHVWVLEASRVPGAPRQIVAKPFDDTPFVPESKEVAKTMTAENAKELRESAAKTAEQKPAEVPAKTTKAKPKPAPLPPVDVVDDDEIPF